MYKVSPFFYILFFILFSCASVRCQMAPGQFKPQDIDAILNSMTEEDFNNILNELSKLSPQELEELEKIGRQVLIESGIDPDTGKPLEQKAGPSESQAKPADQTTAPMEAKQMVKIQNPENIHAILDSIIKNINQLRQKSQGNQEIARRLAQWAESLNDLIFYIKVINKNEHHNRLATKDFEQLFKNLNSLAKQLATAQSNIILPEVSAQEDDPYFVLKLPHTATEQEITQRYKELKKEYSPAAIKARLKNEKASPKEIDRELRAGKLTLSLIQDAYDQLYDTKTKKLIDEKRTHQKTGQLSLASQNALTQAIEAISNSIYQQKILDDLQNFLLKFEPEQLAQKQALETAHTQRKKEQEELAKAKPIMNNAKYDKSYPQHLPRSQADNNYYGGGYGGGNYPYYGGSSDGYSAQQLRKLPESAKGSEGAGKPGSKPSAGAKEGKPQEPDDKTKKMMDELAKKEADKKKEEEKKKMKDLEDRVKKFEEKEKTPAIESKTPVKAPVAVAAPAVGKPPVYTLEASLNDVKDLNANLSALKQELRSQDVRKLLSNSTKALKNPLNAQEIARLSELPFDKLLIKLNTLNTQLSQAMQSTVDALKGQWETLDEGYTRVLSQLNQSIAAEIVKYKGADKPDELLNLQAKINTAIEKYNAISLKLIGRKAITSLPSEEPETEIGLGDIV